MTEASCLRILLTAGGKLPVAPKLYCEIERIIDLFTGQYLAAGRNPWPSPRRLSGQLTVSTLFPWPGSTLVYGVPGGKGGDDMSQPLRVVCDGPPRRSRFRSVRVRTGDTARRSGAAKRNKTSLGISGGAAVTSGQ